MKYIKLFFISVFVFALMIFGISLLFPTITFVSRAMNVGGNKAAVRPTLPQFAQVGFKHLVPAITIDFKPNSDTLVFSNDKVQGGLAVYDAGNDSTTLQVYYRVYAPWYRPWKKFGLMVNEEKYGPSLDSALSEIKKLSGKY